MADGVLTAEYADICQTQAELNEQLNQLLKDYIDSYIKQSDDQEDSLFDISPGSYDLWASAPYVMPSSEDILKALTQSLPDPTIETKLQGLNSFLTVSEDTLPPLMDSSYEETDHEDCAGGRFLSARRGELVKKAGLGNHLRQIASGNFEMTPKLTEAYNRWNQVLPLDEYLRRCRLNE